MMTETLKNQLASELKDFRGLPPTSSIAIITQAYHRILDIIQSLMLTNEDAESHARAWNLLNEDAYKYLSDVQAGQAKAMDDLKYKMDKLGEILAIK